MEARRVSAFAQLVAAAGRHDDGPRLLRRIGKGRHGRVQTPQGPHEQRVQRQIDQQGGDDRNDDGKDDDVARIGQHRIAQMVFLHHHFHEPSVGRFRRAIDAQDAVAIGKGSKRLDDGRQRPGRGGADVDGQVGHQRSVDAGALGQDLAAVADHQNQFVRLKRFKEHLLHHRIARRAIRRVGGRVQRGDGQLSVGQPVLEPDIAEIGDRRHEDQNFGDQDEQNRQHQKLGGQASTALGQRSGVVPGMIRRSGGRRRKTVLRHFVYAAVTGKGEWHDMDAKSVQAYPKRRRNPIADRKVLLSVAPL